MTFGAIFELYCSMKRFLVLVVYLLGHFTQAQHTISGSFFPAEDYSWLIAYRLKPGTQAYVADTSIEAGKFVMKIPENAPTGTYRMVYAVPQEAYYFDVIYNGKEDVKLNFESDKGVLFNTSQENILFSTYFREINALQQELISYYSAGKTSKADYNSILQKLAKTQKSFEEKSENLLAHEFIKGNRPYIPKQHESVQEYVSNTKKNYFNHLDFKNPVLQSSGFLTDKVTNYVFTALPLDRISKEETEKIMQDNIKKVDYFTQGVPATFKFHLFYTIWAQASASSFNDTSDFVFSRYLGQLFQPTDNLKIKDEIEIHNRLRLGAEAPVIQWKNGDTVKKLTDLEGYQNYIVVFWSSTCSHCLKELPALHKKLGNTENIKVIAVGLEDDDITWGTESKKLPNFTHAIALGKWESEYADLYDIHATPSYFILDSDKKIVAKPETDKELVEFLEL